MPHVLPETRRRRPALFAPCSLLLGCAVGAVAAAPPAETPPAFSARYHVAAAGFPVGVMERTFERLPNGRFRFWSLTRAQGLAALFRRERVEESSEGRIVEDGRLEPDRYLYLRQGGKPKTVDIAFDWSVPRVINTVNDQRWNLAIPPGTVDRLVYQLLIMQDVAGSGGAALVYPVADGGKLKTYRFEHAGEESVKVPLGVFATIRLERRYEKADTRASVWVAPALHHLPVRVVHHENGITTRVSLESVQFATAQGTPSALPPDPATTPSDSTVPPVGVGPAREGGGVAPGAVRARP